MVAVWIVVSLLAAANEVAIDVGQNATTFSTAFPASLKSGNDGEVAAQQATDFLAVFLVNELNVVADQPLLGDYRRDGERLVFTPRFRPTPGLLYRIRFTDASGKVSVRDFLSPRTDLPSTTRVERIYPSTDLVPANLLKFYLHFSAPMREGREVFHRIVLLNEKGDAVAAPWRPTELWSEDARRLTLWIHPGRIKEGVALRAAEGPVLEPGQRYTLVVTRQLRDAAGATIASEFRKSFQVGPADHETPSISLWKISPPRSASKEPLRISLPEPLDRHLAARCLKLYSPDDKLLEGRVEIRDEERTWHFLPLADWTEGKHHLVVEEILEDLAGNTPSKPFEVDLAKPQEVAPPLVKAFTITPRRGN